MNFKLAGVLLSVASLGLSLVTQYIDGKNLDAKLDTKVTEKVAEALANMKES